jgi:hypothetical protein
MQTVEETLFANRKTKEKIVEAIIQEPFQDAHRVHRTSIIELFPLRENSRSAPINSKAVENTET